MAPDNESEVAKSKRTVAKKPGDLPLKDPRRWRDGAAARPAGVDFILRSARCPQPPTPDDLVKLSGSVDAILAGRRETS
jgi:hypothetical protein